ncbi:tetratricopeptide repeat protein [Nocardiopsis akebiae]|uniref:Tetratricopeptide repeat protein n=1 Tax=Nocardiopsis akebiae TaxID=2831968 RepID=A0ABX8C1I6_9ACTN|nr:tetratricopeptide repeat protein [Nocardiopsis akebiae]QUX26976.1 tetratricopeptide repeat protein [Nocardiopsis akebiae]
MNMSKAEGEPGGVVNTVNGNIYGGSVIQGRDIRVVNRTAHEVAWPVRVGVIPEPAPHYRHRAAAGHLDTALNRLGTAVPHQVLSGTGGVGKTQMAAQYARALAHTTDPDSRVDVLVWANATSREQITYAYAQAARHLYATVPDDSEDAAELFLVWLHDPGEHQNRRWLVVWDDLTDPAYTRDLWPPHDQPHGRTLVTTRRRDHSLTTQGRHLLKVDVYTPDEARTFLTHALDEAGTAHTTAEADALARDLGYLPLALGQAVTYVAELGMGCEDYLQAFHDRMNTLDQVFPDWDSPVPLAATWDLSLSQADTFTPQGVARPMMGLIALLDGAGVPEQVLTAPPVLRYLADHRTETTGGVTAPPVLTSHQARAALAALARLNLTSRTTQQNAPGPVLVGAHQLVQRATREHAATRPTRTSVHTMADALVHVWPEIERDTVLAQLLRANTAVLRSHSATRGQAGEDWLWDPARHPVLYRAATSLGEAGHAGEALAQWGHMAEAAEKHLGADHLDTLTTRGNLAHWRGKTGDAIGAATAYEHLLTDHLRILGPDHPHTLTTRNNLATWRGEAGDATGAATLYEHLLTDHLRILGPDHPHTLTTRNNLAGWRGEAGDATGAATAYEHLLTDHLRILGPDHPHTLRTRANLATWRGKTGDAAGAATLYEHVFTEMLRALGPDHPHTLTARNNLAGWRGEAGDATGAATAYEHLLTDHLRILGPDHPRTLRTRANLAHWTYASGATDQAIELLTALVNDRTRVLGPEHPETQAGKQVLQNWRVA